MDARQERIATLSMKYAALMNKACRQEFPALTDEVKQAAIVAAELAALRS